MPINDGAKTFYIPTSNINDISRTLKTNGYEVTWIDKKMLTLKKIPERGWYSVDPKRQGRFKKQNHLWASSYMQGRQKQK